MNSDLERAIREAEHALRRNDHGALPLPVRRSLWAALDGDVTGPRRVEATDRGRRRRVHLDEMVVRRVEPLWRERFPEDQRIEQMAEIAHRFAFDECSEEEARKVLADFWTALDNFPKTEGADAFRVSYAGRAAASLVATALEDKVALLALAEDVDDEDLDPYWWETAFWASLAAAGGEPSAPDADDAARRRFWSWYIRSAVPEASDAA